jgi:nucleoside-diphosphate-sugar epimerase
MTAPPPSIGRAARPPSQVDLAAVANVFVTGGSGFVGGRLIARLVADGQAVRALARSESAAAKVQARGAEAVYGDLSDFRSLRSAASGCELAFHAAAAVTELGRWDDFIRANVDGTRAVVDACVAAGVRRLVHVSTEAVLMNGQPLVNVNEETPRRPDSKAPYPATKARAEEIVQAANRDGFETVIVRPRFIWGKGDTTLLPRMVHLAKAGRLAWIGGGANITDVTHVDNVVEGLVLAAAKGRPGEVYFVTDGQRTGFRDFLSDLLRTQGVDPTAPSVPVPVAGALTWAGETAWKLLPLRGAPPLPYIAYWVSSLECTIDISKAQQELGYKPVTSREQGLAELREQAWAK